MLQDLKQRNTINGLFKKKKKKQSEKQITYKLNTVSVSFEAPFMWTD